MTQEGGQEWDGGESGVRKGGIGREEGGRAENPGNCVERKLWGS